VSQTSRSGLERLGMLRLVPRHPAHSRAPVHGRHARHFSGESLPVAVDAISRLFLETPWLLAKTSFAAYIVPRFLLQKKFGRFCRPRAHWHNETTLAELPGWPLVPRKIVKNANQH
jgi:hypothetical protein